MFKSNTCLPGIVTLTISSSTIGTSGCEVKSGNIVPPPPPPPAPRLLGPPSIELKAGNYKQKQKMIIYLPF